MEGVENKCIEKNNRLLISDLRLLPCNNWHHLEIINVFANLINESSQFIDKVTTLLFIEELTQEILLDLCRSWKKADVESCAIILNVRKLKNNSTKPVNIGAPVYHWTCLTISFRNEKWQYVDSLGSSVSLNLLKHLTKFLKVTEKV